MTHPTTARGRPVLDSALALTREKIVSAAVEIVDRHGLAALSMRHLGTALGVDPMAICHYLPNRAALYDAIWPSRTGMRFLLTRTRFR